jgi:glycosyltransferase involved in cell wall biosynthesis
MKVLIVHRYLNIYGGAENVIKELSINLTKYGIKNSVIALNISNEVKEIFKNIEIILPPENLPYKLRSKDFISAVGIYKEVIALRKILKKYYEYYDVINIHNFPATWITYFIEKPVVWYCNEPPDLVYCPNPSLFMKMLKFLGITIDRFMVRNFVNKICVADEINAERVKKRYDIEPEIVPYGVDCDRYFVCEEFRSELKRKYDLKDEIVLVQVGVISPQKNQIESIDVLKELNNKNYSAKLFLVGDDNTPYKEVIVKYIKENGLEKKVIFIGLISKDETVKFYNLADICLFPVKEQGGWLAPFEALCCEKPIIVSTTMGASYIIKNYDFGLVSNNFKEDIMKIINNYSLYKEKAKKASLWIRENLTWENFTLKMISIFKETIKNFYLRGG